MAGLRFDRLEGTYTSYNTSTAPSPAAPSATTVA